MISVNEKWLFPKDFKEATLIQKEMASSVITEDQFSSNLQWIAGVDVSNTPFDPEEMIYSAAVLFSYPSLTVHETSSKKAKQKFPYRTGFLGFREAPLLVDTCLELKQKPDLLMVDGHGISHPRKLGTASHLGVLLDLPTIGVAKSILVGTPAGELAIEAGSQVPLMWKGEEIARVVRTKKRCNPLIISAGHKISLNSAVDLVLKCFTTYRLPEPTRFAHLAANRCRLNKV